MKKYRMFKQKDSIKRLLFYLACVIIFISSADCNSAKNTLTATLHELRTLSVELPRQDSNIIKTSWPSIGCWFWTSEEFKPDGFKRFVDLYEKHSDFGLLTTSLRYPGELTDKKVHHQIKAGAVYAKQKGMGIVMDLDLRLAREVFLKKYPDEMQQIVLLREVPLKSYGTSSITVKSPGFGDHYTLGRSDYVSLKSELLRVYTYKKEKDQVSYGSVVEKKTGIYSSGNKDSITVSVACGQEDEGLTACILIAVTLYTPDVFAPHLLSYQREILQQYSDAPLAGACKDEWGFPGRFAPKTNDLWYSSFMAKAYAHKRPGHDLLEDMILMSFGENGREAERKAAINHYMEMFWQRNAEIETDYYYAIKEYFGKQAMSGTHATWFPYPDEREIFKNGLSWWTSKRDLAQTDESVPFCIRTALSKKMRSPLWYNMYYTGSIKEYHKDLWIAALGGGRLNYHPVWPDNMANLTTSLLQDSLLIAESRINLLNYISTTPVDCPVAVVFGHSSALNWEDRNGFADVGLNVTNALWKEGYYADLIPSSEIENGSLTINSEGKIQYGDQEYKAVVLYKPEYSRGGLADFFRYAANNNDNLLFSIGDWTTGFDGKPFNGNSALPASMKKFENTDQLVQAIISSLKAKKVIVQTTGNMRSIGGFPRSVMPQASGQVHLLDGTFVQVAGKNNVMGDPIINKVLIGDKEVQFDAIGIAAIRLDKRGQVDALAAGGLKSVKIGSFIIELEERADIALFKEKGKWHGVIKGAKGSVPEALTRITKNWTKVRWPEVLKKQ